MRRVRTTLGSAALVMLVALALPGPSSTARGEEPASGSPPDGATLFKERTCFACHGADAKTPILPDYPRLAGQSAPYALQQMKDIKSGARSNGNTAAMKGIMFLVNEEEMQALAEYLSTLTP